jgi:hypothetical protein
LNAILVYTGIYLLYTRIYQYRDFSTPVRIPDDFNPGARAELEIQAEIFRRTVPGVERKTSAASLSDNATRDRRSDHR